MGFISQSWLGWESGVLWPRVTLWIWSLILGRLLLICQLIWLGRSLLCWISFVKRIQGNVEGYKGRGLTRIAVCSFSLPIGSSSPLSKSLPVFQGFHFEWIKPTFMLVLRIIFIWIKKWKMERISIACLSRSTLIIRSYWELFLWDRNMSILTGYLRKSELSRIRVISSKTNNFYLVI